jgi:hypothetical protein
LLKVALKHQISKIKSIRENKHWAVANQ